MLDKAKEAEVLKKKPTEEKLARFTGSSGMQEVGKAIMPYQHPKRWMYCGLGFTAAIACVGPFNSFFMAQCLFNMVPGAENMRS
jgi:hypothetical protein